MQFLKKYLTDLHEENGIFFAKNSQKVSYPLSGYLRNYDLEEKSYWYLHRNKIIARLVKKYSQDKVFFDLGGGNGYVSKGLQDAGLEVVLIEPGSDGALNAKERGVRNIICATLKECGFAESTLPALGVFDVMEHVEDDKTFLDEINYYLKEDAVLYLTVPSYQFLFSAIDLFAGHYRRYSIKGLKKLLASAGFRVEFTTYLFIILPLPIFFFRTLPYWLGIRPNDNQVDAQSKRVHHKKGMTAKLVNKVLTWEINQLKNNRRIDFGSTCLVVARKCAVS